MDLHWGPTFYLAGTGRGFRKLIMEPCMQKILSRSQIWSMAGMELGAVAALFAVMGVEGPYVYRLGYLGRLRCGFHDACEDPCSRGKSRGWRCRGDTTVGGCGGTWPHGPARPLYSAPRCHNKRSPKLPHSVMIKQAPGEIDRHPLRTLNDQYLANVMHILFAWVISLNECYQHRRAPHSHSTTPLKLDLGAVWHNDVHAFQWGRKLISAKFDLLTALSLIVAVSSREGAKNKGSASSA